MRIPYVIDNEQHRLRDVLNAPLVRHKERSLDVATAYFSVGGFGLLRWVLWRSSEGRLPLFARWLQH